MSRRLASAAELAENLARRERAEELGRAKYPDHEVEAHALYDDVWYVAIRKPGDRSWRVRPIYDA